MDPVFELKCENQRMAWVWGDFVAERGISCADPLGEGLKSLSLHLQTAEGRLRFLCYASGPSKLVPSAAHKKPAAYAAGAIKRLAEREGKEPYGCPHKFSMCWTRRVGSVHRIFHRIVWVNLID